CGPQRSRVAMPSRCCRHARRHSLLRRSSRAPLPSSFSFLVSTAPAPTELSTLSLHDALPIYLQPNGMMFGRFSYLLKNSPTKLRSEEHTSELQSRFDLVCRLLLEKKKTPVLHA